MAKKGMEGHMSPTVYHLLLDKRSSWLRPWTLQRPCLPHLKHLLCSPSPVMFQLPPSGTVNTAGHREEMRQRRSNTLPLPKRMPLADYVLRMAERGYPATVKLLRYLAWVIARRRSSTFQIPANDDGVRAPGKNWPQGFYKRHPQLRPRTLRPIDWARYDIYEKVTQ
jgi:hypothetical protein